MAPKLDDWWLTSYWPPFLVGPWVSPDSAALLKADVISPAQEVRQSLLQSLAQHSCSPLKKSIENSSRFGGVYKWNGGRSGKVKALTHVLTSHPRIAHGQRYTMPCWEWSNEEVEWEQGSGPKGPMSCRTQGWISIRPERACLRP